MNVLKIGVLHCAEMLQLQYLYNFHIELFYDRKYRLELASTSR